MILYHGTTDKFLSGILAKGIQPRLVHGNSVYKEIKMDSHQEFVYLSDRYPMFYADLACQYMGGNPVIFQIEIDESMLYPDEDFIGTRLAKQEKIKSKKEVKELILSINPRDYREYWKDSLKIMGTVAVEWVPERFIKKYLVVPKDMELYQAIGWDTNPQAHAEFGLLQSVVDSVPGRLPFNKALEIYFRDGREALMAERDKAHAQMNELFAKMKDMKPETE